MWMSFSTSPSISFETGMPVHLATTSAMSSSSTSSLRKPASPVGALLRLAPSSLLELRDLAVAQLGRALEVGLALGALGLAVGLLELLLQRRGSRRSRPSRPATAAFIASSCSRRSASSRSIASRRAPAGVVLLLLERLLLDLELHDAALDLVDLGRHRVDLDAQPRRRLVDQVDRLVGQEAVGDVAVRERRRGDDRGVLDAHAVVHLVALLEPAQDRDRVLDGRLVDEDRLEAALERGVLLDVLAVLVERGRADGAQLAAREHRLEQVGGVHRALGGAGADDRVQLVDEQDDRGPRPRRPP